ncbi:MAG: hypothetical protein AAGU75_23520, partial [Bacillota bacterium]
MRKKKTRLCATKRMKKPNKSSVLCRENPNKKGFSLPLGIFIRKIAQTMVKRMDAIRIESFLRLIVNT